MEVEKSKQAVLVNLRGVIQSCKGGVPLSRLQSDYKSLIGATIPFTNLGHNSLEAFLQSIPQVIQLKKISGGQTIVEAVADSTTVHLQSLISKQKSTKTQKCSVKRCGKKSAAKQKSSIASSSSSRSVLVNSSASSSSANSKGSVASDVSNIKYKQEIEALKAKLAKEKEMSNTLKHRVSQLLSESEPELEDEDLMIQRLQYQVGILKKQMLLHHPIRISLLAASPETMQVHQSINEIAEKIEHLAVILEKLPNHSTTTNSLGVTNGNSQQVPKFDPFKMYQQQCKETEELKKQVALQNSQIQNIEKRMQSQLQKLQNQIKNDSPSKEKSELLDDLRNKEQSLLQIQNVEKNIMQEFMKLKNQVETEFFVHLVCESEKVKEFDKQLKTQKTQIQNIESGTQSKIQKLNNKLDKISTKNLVDIIVKKLVSSNMINIPQILSSSNNCERYVPPHRRAQESAEQMPNLPTNSKTTSFAKIKKKKKKSIKTETSGMATSVIKD